MPSACVTVILTSHFFISDVSWCQQGWVTTRQKPNQTQRLPTPPNNMASACIPVHNFIMNIHGTDHSWEPPHPPPKIWIISFSFKQEQINPTVGFYTSRKSTIFMTNTNLYNNSKACCVYTEALSQSHLFPIPISLRCSRPSHHLLKPWHSMYNNNNNDKSNVIEGAGAILFWSERTFLLSGTTLH